MAIANEKVSAKDIPLYGWGVAIFLFVVLLGCSVVALMLFVKLGLYLCGW